jgi:hypothetical protein
MSLLKGCGLYPFQPGIFVGTGKCYNLNWPARKCVSLHTSEQDFETRQHRTGQWLIRVQSEVPRTESSFEAKRRQQKERLWDLEHCLRHDWRFANLICQTQHLGPGRSRDKVIEEFRISVYNGYHLSDLGILQLRGRAVANYLHLRDEIDEVEEAPPIGSPAGVNFWRQW